MILGNIYKNEFSLPIFSRVNTRSNKVIIVNLITHWERENIYGETSSACVVLYKIKIIFMKINFLTSCEMWRMMWWLNVLKLWKHAIFCQIYEVHEKQIMNVIYTKFGINLIKVENQISVDDIYQSSYYFNFHLSDLYQFLHLKCLLGGRNFKNFKLNNLYE